VVSLGLTSTRTLRTSRAVTEAHRCESKPPVLPCFATSSVKEYAHSGYFPRQARDRHKERSVKGGGRLCLRTGYHCPTRRPASAAGWVRWALRGQSLQVHQVRNAIWITNSPYKLTICQDRLGTNKRKTQQKIAFRIARMSMTTAVHSR
jgi:hypothetical protein